jgi:hypothetical protein
VWKPVSLTAAVPMFQPANQYGGYLGPVYVFVDSNPDGVLQRPTDLGTSTILTRIVTGATSEAYRQLSFDVNVPVDRRVQVSNLLLDIGESPQGFGLVPDSSLTPGLFHGTLAFSTGVDPVSGVTLDPLAPYDSSNAAVPSFAPWFRTLSATNVGNTNLLNVKVAKSNLTSDTVQDIYYGGPAQIIPSGNVATTLDAPFWNDPVWGLFLPASTYGRTFHKAKVGGTAPDLRIPDVAPPASIFIMDPNGPQQAALSVAVPVGQPVGTYTGTMTLFEDSDGSGG